MIGNNHGYADNDDDVDDDPNELDFDDFADNDDDLIIEQGSA